MVEPSPGGLVLCTRHLRVQMVSGIGYVVLLTTLRPPDVIKLPPYLMLSLSCGRAPRPGLILVHLNTRTGHRGATPCCPVPSVRHHVIVTAKQ